MKNLKNLSLGFLTLLMISGFSLGVQAAETVTPSLTAKEIKQQLKQLREERKTKKAEHKEEVKSSFQEMTKIREQYQDPIADLKKQRDDAVKAGNKEQAKLFSDQIKTIRAERHEKLQAVRSEIKEKNAKMREAKKTLKEKAKDLKNQKKALKAQKKN